MLAELTCLLEAIKRFKQVFVTTFLSFYRIYLRGFKAKLFC